MFEDSNSRGPPPENESLVACVSRGRSKSKPRMLAATAAWPMVMLCVLAFFAVPLSLTGCSHANQAASAKSRSHPTKASSLKPPQQPARRFSKARTASSVKPPPLPAMKPTALSFVKLPPLPRRKPTVHSPQPPTSPSTSLSPDDTAGFYLVRDAAGNCAVVDYKPSASTGLKIIEWSDSAECNDVVKKEALIGTDDQRAEAKLEAAQAKAKKLGGVDKLTPKDIEGLAM